MDLVAGMTRQYHDLVGSVIVHRQGDVKAGREVRLDVVEKPQELSMPTPSAATADRNAAGHIQGREQGSDSMPLIIMRSTRGARGAGGRIGWVRFSA
jgi:hypothetical protein